MKAGAVLIAAPLRLVCGHDRHTHDVLWVCSASLRNPVLPRTSGGDPITLLQNTFTSYITTYIGPVPPHIFDNSFGRPIVSRL